MNRYARQIQLPEIGLAGQAKLTEAHIAVVGAGGLGCPALQYIAGAGVGQITIIDPDCIEESNLHRQPLYRMNDLGRPKAEAARDALLSLNPDVQVHAQIAALGPATAQELVESADIVIDASDSFAVSYILSDACLAAKTPFISASVLGQTGYVGSFCDRAPSLRAVFPELPASGATCATAGVLGPVVGLFGALQAQIALRILLGTTPSPQGQMITADLADLRFGRFSFLGSPEPEIDFPFVAEQMLQKTDLIVELRCPHEAPEKIRPDAKRLSEAELRALVLHPGQRVVLCCQSGLRAWRAAGILQMRGADNLALLAVGASS